MKPPWQEVAEWHQKQGNCSPTMRSNWWNASAIAENETKIEFDEELYTIESLTSTQLKVSVTTTSQGTTVVQNITFSH